MPKYRVLAPSFINNSLAKEGDVVDYDGKPGSNLEALDAPAQAAASEAARDLGKKDLSVSDLTRQKVAAIGGDPEAVELAQAASVAAAAANAVLTGHTVQIDNKPVETPSAGRAPAPTTSGAEGLV
jgi:hypothetical protein